MTVRRVGANGHAGARALRAGPHFRPRAQTRRSGGPPPLPPHHTPGQSIHPGHPGPQHSASPSGLSALSPHLELQGQQCTRGRPVPPHSRPPQRACGRTPHSDWTPWGPWAMPGIAGPHGRDPRRVARGHIIGNVMSDLPRKNLRL